MALQFLCLILLIPACLFCIYYVFLAFWALIHSGKKTHTENGEFNKFAIVIPAYNEENVISMVLGSCAELDYPKDKFQVFVIADNCTDKTAEVAKRNGVACLERNNLEKRGKGFALEWAFESILPEKYDVFLVLDADCRLETHALKTFNSYIQRGEKVLQANDVASNPDTNAMSYAVSVGNLIENELFYAPKSDLGLAVFLRGTGMVIRREILERFPWHAQSVAEDSEYTLFLAKNGIKVKFVKEVRVLSEFPENSEQLRIQRLRWASGNIKFGKSHAMKLMWEGLIKGHGLLIDAGWTILVLSRPLVLLELFIALVLGMVCAWWVPNSFSNLLMLTGLVLLLFQGTYYCLGILILGINLRRILLLFGTPIVVLRLILISLMSIVGVRDNLWAKTPR